MTLKKLFLSFALLAFSAGLSNAGEGRQVVLNSYNEPVTTAHGCLYTKWKGSNVDCFVLTAEERTIYFDFGSSAVKKSERKKLDKLVKIAGKNKQIRKVSVVGFADSIGNARYNKRLSKRRASNVRNYLRKRSRVFKKLASVDVEGLGETGSSSRCKEIKNRKQRIKCGARDRRVEVRFEF